MWCENEIEYILEHLQDPERLMDGEFVEWLEKKNIWPFSRKSGINGKLFYVFNKKGI